MWMRLLRFRLLVSALSMVAFSGCGAKTATPGSKTAYSPDSFAADVVGDLGGVPVLIPGAYARLVEYEGDPHWLERRNGPPPVRTVESKLASFGILARYPDMKPLTKEEDAGYRRTKFKGSEWIRVSVFAGSRFYLKDKGLDRPYEFKVPGQEPHRSYAYDQMPTSHGLTPYRATKNHLLDLNLEDQNPDHSFYNHILYFAREHGRIVAVIRCGTGATSTFGGTHTCQHRFLLWPQMKAEVELSYADGLLSNWRKYQESFRTLLLGFRVGPR